MTQTFAEGDLVEAVKGEDVHRGRVEARMEGLLCLGESGYRLDYYEREGFTLTVIEKALPPLPTEPGAYAGRTGSVYVLDADGEWFDYSEWRGSKWATGPVHYLPLTRLAPVAEVLGKVQDAFILDGFARDDRTAEIIGRISSFYGVTK